MNSPRRSSNPYAILAKLGAFTLCLAFFGSLAWLASAIAEAKPNLFVNRVGFLANASNHLLSFEGECATSASRALDDRQTLLEVKAKVALDDQPVDIGAEFSDDQVDPIEELASQTLDANASESLVGAEFFDDDAQTRQFASVNAQNAPEDRWKSELDFEALQTPVFVEVASQFWENDDRFSANDKDDLLSNEEMKLFLPSTLLRKDGSTTYNLSRFVAEAKAEVADRVDASKNNENKSARDVRQTSAVAPVDPKADANDRVDYVVARPYVEGGVHRRYRREYQ